MHLDNSAIYIFAATLAWNLGVFTYGSIKVIRLFRTPQKPHFRFRERMASGHSRKNFFTRLGGSHNALDICLTDTELWIRGILPPFSYIGMWYDLTHRIPLQQITEATADESTLNLHFTDSKGTDHHLRLHMKQAQELSQHLNG